MNLLSKKVVLEPVMVVCTYNPSYLEGGDRRPVFQGQLGQKRETLSKKLTKRKRARLWVKW
jgi:hypothetical protein